MNIFWVWDGFDCLVEVEHSDDGIKFEWIIEEPYYQTPLEEAVSKLILAEQHVESRDELGLPVIASLTEFTMFGRKYELEYQAAEAEVEG